MSNCTLTVHLTGSHHNKGNEKDANRMAVKFVDELKAAGHNVEHASFTHGGRDDLLDPGTISRSAFYKKE